jgi:hypothetical protein
MPKLRDRGARDRRDPRVDVVGNGRAFDIHYVAAGRQTLTGGALCGLAVFS